MKKKEIKINGMHCKSCEMLIKDELMELGVKECEIDHKSGKAKLTFDDSISLDSIKSIIKKQGYGVD